MDDFEFDLPKWLSRFPIEQVPEKDYGGRSVCSPITIAVVEQLRREAVVRHDLGPSVPTDIFAFGYGEPDRRDVTKVNGLPYRPAGKPWPLRPHGSPMTFLCQFRFTESKDIVGALPGDILLMFVPDACISFGRDEPVFYFEWYPLGLTDLVRPEEPPSPAWEFVTCYGIRHRSVDYVDAAGTTTDAIRELLPEGAIRYGAHSAHAASRWVATKIGGQILWLNLLWGSEYDQRSAAELPGRLLCSLSSIGPSFDVKYPWINRPDPIDVFDIRALDRLLFRDGFILHFQIDDHGELHWFVQYS